MPRLNRRTFLRSAGVCIGLPLLDAMLPVGLGAEQKAAALRRRILLISRPLGYHAEFFFPKAPGKDYELTRYLKPLAPQRQDFTVFSGMSHRGYPSGHHAEVALFTGVAPDGVRDMNQIRNSISLDQEIAERLGSATRFPYLTLGGGGTGALSWNRKGVKIPAEARATLVFKQLFIDGTPQEVAREIDRLKHGQSILDGVRDQAKTMARTLGPADRERLDLLLTRSARPSSACSWIEAWVSKPKPKVTVQPPNDDYVADRQKLERDRQWFDLVKLALQTDSTRVIALWLWSYGPVNLPGVGIGHHDATHHGQDEAKIKQLGLIEEAEMRLFADFLAQHERDQRWRPALARPERRVLRQQPGQRLRPLLRQPADHPRRRRLQARRPCGLQSPGQQAVVEPLRPHGPTDRRRHGSLRQQHRHTDRGVTSSQAQASQRKRLSARGTR